jgi:hypothetical protein
MNHRQAILTRQPRQVVVQNKSILRPSISSSPESRTYTLPQSGSLDDSLRNLANFQLIPCANPNNNLAELVGIWATSFKYENPNFLTPERESKLYNDALKANTNRKLVKIIRALRDLGEKNGAPKTGGLIRNVVAKRYHDTYETKGIWDDMLDACASQYATFQPSDESEGYPIAPPAQGGKKSNFLLPILLGLGVFAYMKFK